MTTQLNQMTFDAPATSLPRIALADWRRRIAELYARIRSAPAARQPEAWQTYCAVRDDLFKHHPQTPLDAAQRANFTGLDYYPYNPEWRVIGRLNGDVSPEIRIVHLADDGQLRYTVVARVEFAIGGVAAALNLFWIEGYGGGLFLPFRDTTNGNGTFGGGRYLYDSIKGADLGANGGEIVLDFNYAYNPSCGYNSHWVCPLSPPENRLPFAVTAGEKVFAG